MGCPVSKLKKVPKRKLSQTIEINDKNNAENDWIDGDPSDANLIKKRDEEVISVIKRDLNETPELFVLNNVLLGTRFLRNYHEEINHVFHHIEKTDDQYWEPDIIMARANRNMIFRPMHGPKKDLAEPLVTRRIYIPMNEYISVHNPFDDEELTGNTKKYQVKIEEGKRDGYVRLQRVNMQQESTSIKETLSVPLSSNTSGSSDTESTGTSMGLGTEENRQFVKDQIEEGTLDDCFVFRRNKKADIDLDLEELDHENLSDDDVYDIISYLPPKTFMQYFQTKVFKDKIKEQLGLVQYEIDQAVVDKHVPGKIFCNLRDANGNCYPVEIMPCLKCTWPSRQTYDFMSKHLKDQFRWPTDEMLSELTKLQCALVPRGFAKKQSKGDDNSNETMRGDLEWEIKFPLAESYLETVLRPEQIKCYLTLISLYKEHLEPYTKCYGITPEHFLTLILWESEKNYQEWPEHRLGGKFVEIIGNISNTLCQRSLKGFFIRKRNVLRNVSRKHLEFANEVFHRIKESPLTYFIRALRNIRHTSGSFYPPLNYKELMEILYKKDWEEVNYLNAYDDVSLSTNGEKKPKFADAEKQLAYVKERERRRKLMKKKQMKNNSGKNVHWANIAYSAVNVERRGSCDSIDLDWECEKRFHKQKKCALLKFFINHHLDMAASSFKIATLQQTMFYVKQAWYLAKILKSETELFPEESLSLLEKIEEEEDKVLAIMEKNLLEFGQTEAPTDEKDVGDEELDDVLSGLDDVCDNVDGFDEDFDVYAEVIRQIRQTKINLRALSRQFNSNFIEADRLSY